jgi:hypothetical protein
VPAVVTLHRRLRRGSILTTRRNCGSRNSRSHRSRGRLTREQKEGRKEGRKGEESERVVETGAFSIPLETTPKT